MQSTRYYTRTTSLFPCCPHSQQKSARELGLLKKKGSYEADDEGRECGVGAGAAPVCHSFSSTACRRRCGKREAEESWVLSLGRGFLSGTRPDTPTACPLGESRGGTCCRRLSAGCATPLYSSGCFACKGEGSGKAS